MTQPQMTVAVIFIQKAKCLRVYVCVCTHVWKNCVHCASQRWVILWVWRTECKVYVCVCVCVCVWVQKCEWKVCVKIMSTCLCVPNVFVHLCLKSMYIYLYQKLVCISVCKKHECVHLHTRVYICVKSLWTTIVCKKCIFLYPLFTCTKENCFEEDTLSRVIEFILWNIFSYLELNSVLCGSNFITPKNAFRTTKYLFMKHDKFKSYCTETGTNPLNLLSVSLRILFCLLNLITLSTIFVCRVKWSI